MSDVNTPETPEVVLEPVVEPVVEAVAPVEAPVELPEQRYEYQPQDELGRPIGGKQVIVYRTEEELRKKLTEQNVLILRKLREVTKKQRLGITDDTIPDELERFERPVEFKEKNLTPEDIFSISQDLNNPEKFSEARDRLLESAVGATPAELRKVLNEQQITTMQLLARTNAATFMERHPDFYGCEENLETLTSWMLRNGLAPTVKNFEAAHQKLQEAGLFLASPIVREEAPSAVPAPAAPVVENTAVNSQPPAAVPGRITENEPPQGKRQSKAPSGLNSRVASTAGKPNENGTLTLREVDKLSADEFARKYNHDLVFRAAYDKLAASQKPAQPVQPPV